MRFSKALGKLRSSRFCVTCRGRTGTQYLGSTVWIFQGVKMWRQISREDVSRDCLKEETNNVKLYKPPTNYGQTGHKVSLVFTFLMREHTVPTYPTFSKPRNNRLQTIESCHSTQKIMPTSFRSKWNSEGRNRTDHTVRQHMDRELTLIGSVSFGTSLEGMWYI